MMAVHHKYQPDDLQIRCDGDAVTFHGTCRTTHEADYLIAGIEIFKRLMPSSREMLWSDIFFHQEPKESIVAEMMKVIAP